MWIRRLAVKHWRGLDDVALDDLSPHLNLISGANESGKSRLVQALRFALFESSHGKGAHKKALASWGGDGRPQVVLEFEHLGERWWLDKTFLGAGYDTTLRSTSATLSGEDAERRLSQLLNVAPGGARELKPQERGIWPLLWVEQGDSAQLPTHGSGESAKAVLQDRLTREIGEVAAGAEGQQVLARARDLYQRFYTPSTGAEREPLKAAREAHELAVRSHAQALAQQQLIAQDADALQRELAREADLLARRAQTEVRLRAIEQQHAQSSAAAARVQIAEERLRSAQARCNEKQREVDSGEELRAHRARINEQLERLSNKRDAQQRQRSRCRDDEEKHTVQVAAADQIFDIAKAELDAARRRADRAALAQEHAAAQRCASDARDVAQRLDALIERLRSVPVVTPSQLSVLRACAKRADEARATLQGVAAAVSLTAHQTLRVDNQDVAAGQSLSVFVDDERSIEIEGVASLRIRPGGGELARLRDAATDAQRALREQLAELGVADLASAEQACDAHREGERERRALEQARDRLLPDGPDALAQRLAHIAQRLDETPQASDDEAVPIPQAEARLRDAEERRETARTRRNLAVDATTEARQGLAVLDARLQAQRDQLEALDERISTLATADDQRAALKVATRDFAEAAAIRDAARQTYQDLGGEQLELSLQQARQAHAALDNEYKQCRDSRIRLETRIEHVGEDGNHEYTQALAAEMTRTATELTRVEREAAAARRLYEVLSDSYTSTQERLAEPVIERIRPFLSDVFPHTSLWLDERLQLKGLRGERFNEDFEMLSGGAQEQLSLLVRLGLADVVAGTGNEREPWPLVLDDILVNTDPERITRLQRALFFASRQFQIILFSCHGAQFDTLGADRVIELRPRVR